MLLNVSFTEAGNAFTNAGVVSWEFFTLFHQQAAVARVKVGNETMQLPKAEKDRLKLLYPGLTDEEFGRGFVLNAATRRVAFVPLTGKLVKVPMTQTTRFRTLPRSLTL